MSPHTSSPRVSSLPTPPSLGVIEAFYGRPWTVPARLAMLEELATLGYRYYVYAPKSDRKLRADWQQPWSTGELEQLQLLVQRGKAANIAVGVGFSPLGLHTLDGAAARALDAKAQQLGELGASRLYILFDDMQASGDAMASNQLRIVEFICQRAAIDAIVVCPSYYSTDPVLEKIFGPRPAAYWRELGQGLD
ncbi:MAG: beta-N-acetylglucosaminidase domain-containing protein, partial [Gammaproteobacteria bacterium]|nr:beta-N-acetylglucosaminidase domain-containing protein [Gammaproteobacteria bacterium]